MRTRQFCIGFGVLGIVLLGASFLWTRSSVGSPPAQPSECESASIDQIPDDKVVSNSELATAREEAVVKRTVRDYLREYYGDDWERMRATVEERLGTKLDLPLEEYPIQPWGEVEEELKARTLPSAEVIVKHAEEALEWDPALVSNWDSIRLAFPNVPEDMRDIELQEFRAIADEANGKIREKSQQRMAVFTDLCTHKWSKGEFIKAPYCLPPNSNAAPAGRVAVAQLLTNSSTGWIVQMPIYRDELPAEYVTLGKDIEKDVYARTTKLSQYLASKQ